MLIRILISLFVLLCGANSFAQPATDNESANNSGSSNLSEFISKLKNPQERKKLIANLEQLEKAQANENHGFSIKEALGIDELIDQMVADYRETLLEYSITSSNIGSVITILFAITIIGLLVWLNRRLSYWFDCKFEPVRKNYNLAGKRFKLYFKFQRFAGYILGVLLALYSIIEFSMLPKTLKEYVNFINIIESFFSLFLVIFIFVSIWEFVNAAVEFMAHKNKALQSSRAKTLIPLGRNILMFLTLVMAGMVVLSELGVDIVPLLAGAGVVGIAVGFGAQKLVKDFLTGFTIILEDLLQIGDVVTLAGRTGMVEKITLRKIQLRHLNGTVYTIPFGEVDIVENLTKDFSYYLMDIGVAYREDIDEVCQCLEEVDKALRETDEFRSLILEPLEIMGVDQFADSAVVIKARIKTLPKKQWLVGREFNRRIKYLFDERNIEIPFPHQTIYFGQDKDGKAPKAPVKLYDANQKTEKVS